MTRQSISDDSQFGDADASVGLRPHSTGRDVLRLVVLLVVASGLAILAALYYLRLETSASAEKLNHSLTHLIGEQTSRTIQTVDQRLEIAGEQLRLLQARNQASEDAVRAMLRGQLKQLPFVRAMWVLDKDGRIAFDSDVGNIGISLADREYFAIYAKEPATGFHIGKPVKSRSVGTWLVSASRPLRDSKGAIEGVVVAAMLPTYFNDMWSGIELGHNGVIALFRSDAVFLMRSPADDAVLGKTFPQLSLFTEELPRSPVGTLHVTSVIDQRQRLVSYRRLEPYTQLVLVLGRADAVVFADWHRLAWLSGLIWLIGSALGLTLAWRLALVARARHAETGRFKQLAHSMPQIVFIMDLHGNVLFANAQWTRATGLPQEAALGKNWLQYVHPDDLAPLQEALLHMLGQTTTTPAEFRLRGADQAYRWQMARASPNRDSTGQITAWFGTSTDIDGFKRAQAALQVKTDLLRTAGQISKLGGWALTVPDHVMVWSDEARQILDLDVDSHPTLNQALHIVQPATMAIAVNALRECEQSGVQFDIEIQVTTPKERRLWLRSLGRAVYDETGHIVRLEGALQDITERKRAERTQQRTAAASQSITQHRAVDTVLQEVADQARSIIGAHQAAIRITLNSGVPMVYSARSYSEKYADYSGLDDPIDSGLETMFDTPGTPMRLTPSEVRKHPRFAGLAQPASGRPGLRGWLAVPLKSRDGKRLGLLQLSDRIDGEFSQQDEYIATELAQLAAIAIDNVRLLAEVSALNSGLEEKVAQRTAELTRQEALFRTLAQEAPQPIFTVDPRGHVTFLSQAWYKLVGGAPPDWLGDTWLQVIHPDDIEPMKENWRQCRATLAPFRGTRRLLAKSGAYHTMAYRASPVQNDAGEVMFWVGIDADISELKEIEDALRLSNSELEAFSYSVSHDLRAPLNSIDGFSRLLGKLLSDDAEPKMQHYLARIQAATAHMGDLIEGLLTLARVTRAELDHDAVNLSALATDILGRLQADEPQRTVQIEVAPDLTAMGDKRLLRVVLENLLGNAWKFSAQRAEARITVGRSHQPDAVFVRDNGAGFDMTYVDKLFGAFQRLHSASEFSGTGIGLATAHRVIARHGGHIWAQATPDEGATFYFTLASLSKPVQP